MKRLDVAPNPEIRHRPGLHEKLDEAVDGALQTNRVVGAVVLVAQDGEVVYRRAAGWADREARIPMREDAIFLLASLTKPIVTMALMRLVEEGRVGLDDPVTRWLPDFKPAMKDGRQPLITIHHLLTHTAGLSYGFLEPPDGDYRRLRVSDGLDQPGLGLEENLARIAAAPLAFSPGSAWRYSVALDVVGAIVARAAGQPLPEAVRARITDHLGMTDTAFVVKDPRRLVRHYGDASPQPVPMGEAHDVVFNGSKVTFAPRRWMDPGSYASGGAGIAGTAGDFLRFLEAVHAGARAPVGEVTLQQMRSPHVGPEAMTQGPGWGFGYGWAVLIDPAAAQSPQSPGTLQWGGAYGHSWFVDPVRRLSVVALTNTALEGMAGAFPASIRDAVYAGLATRDVSSPAP